MSPLADSHDVLLLDLDGTVYLGGQVIPHVVDSLAEAARRGAPSMYITNNASRPPAEVAGSLLGMGMPARPEDVLTSPEAAATMLAATHPADSAVLVVGAQALVDAVAAVGLRPVRLATDNPVAVVQGHSPDTGWRDLAEACIAIRGGVDWVASNTDSTLPTERGLLPGNGAMVAALRAATGKEPRVAGKPNRPLLDAAVERAGASRPLVVGDRLDTDIEAAVTAGMPSLFVLTGVSTAADLLAAPASRRPEFVAFDLRGLNNDDFAVRIDPSDGADGPAEPDWSVHVTDRVLRLTSCGSSRDAGPSNSAPSHDSDPRRTLCALAMLAVAAWSSGVTEVDGADDAARDALLALALTTG